MAIAAPWAMCGFMGWQASPNNTRRSFIQVGCGGRFEKRPLSYFTGRHLDELLAGRMESFEHFAELVLAASGPSDVAWPFLHRSGDEVDLVAPMGEEIDYEMSIRRPPFCKVIDLEIAKALSRERDAMADIAAIDSTCSGPRIDSRQRECTPSAPITISACALLPSSNFMVTDDEFGLKSTKRSGEMNCSWRYSVDKHRVHVAAMDCQIRSAVPRLRNAFERETGKDLARIPHAADPRVRLDSEIDEFLSYACAIENFHTIRSKVNSRA